MTANEIITLIIAIVPSIGVLLGVLVSVLKIVKSFNELLAGVKDQRNAEALKEYANKMQEENIMLKQKLNQIIEALTKIEVNDNESSNT